MILEKLKIIPTLHNSFICDGCQNPLVKHKRTLEVCDDDLVNLLLCKECVIELIAFLKENLHLIDVPRYDFEGE